MQQKAASAADRDWARSAGAFLVAWGLPTLVLAAAAFLDPPLRAAAWSGALLWMGAACLANARRCGRVHCRYTGPYYLALILLTVPLGAVPGAPSWAWWALGLLIVLGSKVIWYATEAAWGTYRE